jgi:hypothetical protein
MADEPKDLPTYEDALRELGPDLMSFMSEMVRPDQHEERGDDPIVPTVKTQTQTDLTPEEERAVIEHTEKDYGRKLTQQEINLALRQAHDIGYL